MVPKNGTIQVVIQEGHGSRVRIALHSVRAVFHRPHPAKEVCKGTILSLRKFLRHAKVNYDEV